MQVTHALAVYLWHFEWTYPNGVAPYPLAVLLTFCFRLFFEYVFLHKFRPSPKVVNLVVLTGSQFKIRLFISQLLAKAIPVRGAILEKPAQGNLSGLFAFVLVDGFYERTADDDDDA